jgi:hypothetical protein
MYRRTIWEILRHSSGKKGVARARVRSRGEEGLPFVLVRIKAVISVREYDDHPPDGLKGVIESPVGVLKPNVVLWPVALWPKVVLNQRCRYLSGGIVILL